MIDVFTRMVIPLAGPETRGSLLAGRRLVAIDGTDLDLPDTPSNVDFFGRPALIWGEYATFPQARLVGLAECGTHAILDAEIGPRTKLEIALSRDLVGRLKPGTTVCADGPWLALIIPTSGTDRRRTAPLMVRVIDYTVDDGRENPELDRLLTTILDPTKATAEDLATVASRGWEIGSSRKSGGYLCYHYALRGSGRFFPSTL